MIAKGFNLSKAEGVMSIFGAKPSAGGGGVGGEAGGGTKNKALFKKLAKAALKKDKGKTDWNEKVTTIM